MQNYRRQCLSLEKIKYNSDERGDVSSDVRAMVKSNQKQKGWDKEISLKEELVKTMKKIEMWMKIKLKNIIAIKKRSLIGTYWRYHYITRSENFKILFRTKFTKIAEIIVITDIYQTNNRLPLNSVFLASVLLFYNHLAASYISHFDG